MIISVGVGGFAVSLIVPRLQHSWQEAKYLLEKRRELAEQIVLSFGAYITGWRRLRVLASKEMSSGLTEIEKARKEEALGDRRDARDRLFGSLRLARIFFDTKTVQAINEFTSWDEMQTSKKLEELPELQEWRYYERKIFDQIKREIG